jgi:hypothetical protein
MTFMNPLLLFAGLGIALPILAHLLNRERVKRTDWAAMQFLNRSIHVRSRELRLRDFLLLLLRCLAVLLLALAISKPTMKKAEGLAAQFGERRAGVIIALDASFSMQHTNGSSTRFQRAVDQINLISDQIHTGDPVCLVLLGGEHRVLIRNMAFDAQRFSTILQAQQVAPEPLDVDSVPKLLKELAEGMEALQKEIYIVTDLQTQDWKHRPAHLHDSLEELGKSSSVFIVPVQSGPENLAITSLDLVSGVLRKGTIARYRATVRNCGTKPASQVKVHCLVDGTKIDSKTIPLIEAGVSETVSLFVPFHNTGPTRITAELEADALPADNERRAVAVVRNRVSVLCVDGSSGDAGGLIAAALLARDSGTDAEDFAVRSVPWLSLPAQDLKSFDVVVLSDVPDITPGQASRLEEYVREGNGLIWFAGDNVKIPEWNQRSASEGTPLLPAVIEQVVDTSDAMGAGRPLDRSMPDHSVCRPLLSLPEDLFSETRFQKRLQVKSIASSFPVLSLAGSTSPILIEHALGRGQVFMFTTSAQPSWNNMALTPVFPMLLQRMVTYLAGREFEKPRLVGDSLSLSYVDRPDANDAVFDTPSGRTLSVPVREHRNQYVALLDNAREAGFYLARVSVQAPGMPVAVNVDTRESNVQCLPVSDLRSSLDGTGIVVAESETDLLGAIESSRTGLSFWRFFMAACLVVFVFESLFADRMLRSRSRSDKPAPSPANTEAPG